CIWVMSSYSCVNSLCHYFSVFFFFFFFQAEDGIRDATVTGVQTCALPILVREHQVLAAEMQIEARSEQFHAHGAALDVPPRPARSEERRVGKECRSRRSPEH